jgi:outer membrane receptor protein involved in Fe transport
MRFVTLLALAAFVIPAALAQPRPQGGGLTGQVLDAASGEPLPLATVALYQLPDTTFVTGAAADTLGAFSIAPLRPGEYQVRVSVVGYDTERLTASVRPSPPVDLGEIRLAESTELLEGVAIEAERELIEQRADRTVYNVAEQPITSGDNVLETLKTLPSVEVDQDDNLSLRGGRNVAVHVNGRPVPVGGQFLAAYLKQIGADGVERIEVIPNPSARYEPDGLSGIINIVLKEDAPDRGLSGGVTLGGGTRPEANLGLNLAYQRGRFDVYGSYGYFYNRFGFDGSTERDYLGTASELLTLDNVQDGDRLFASHFSNATVDYTPAEGTTISLSGNVSLRDGGGENLQSILSVYRDGGRETLAERLSDTDNDGTNATGTLAFQRRFPSAGSGQADGTHELRAEARASLNTNTDDQLFVGTLDGSPERSSYLEDSERSESWLQVDYTRPLPGNVRLETGAKATWETIANDVRFGFGGDEGLAEVSRDGFDYDRSIYAGYLQAAVPFGSKFEAQAGLRVERAERSFVIDSEGTTNDFDYTSLFPSAFVIYNVEPGTSVKGSYSRRINRPGTWFLSPFASPEDATVSQRGNPDLRPEYTDSFEMAFQYKFFATVTPFYRRTTDVISRRFLIEDERTFFTSDNFATEQSYGADLTLAGPIPKTPLRGFVSGSVFRSETDGGAVDPTIDFGVTSWSARASLQAQLREGTSVQFFGFFRGPRAIANGRASGFGFTSVGLQQKFMDDALSLSVRVTDPFSTTRFEFESENEAFTEFGVRDPAQRSVAATLTWTFGKPSERRPQQQAPQGGGGMDGGGIGL